MTDIESGISSPGGINGLLMWQQVSSTFHNILDLSNRPAPSYVPRNTRVSSLTNTQDS